MLRTSLTLSSLLLGAEGLSYNHLTKKYSSEVTTSKDLPDCEVYHENQCEGDVIVTDEKYEDYRWYTPQKGDEYYQSSYQDYAFLTGHSQIVYSADRKSATVELVTSQKTNSTLSYYFDGVEQSSPTKTFSAATSKAPVLVEIHDKDKHVIELDPLDFVWNAPAVTPLDPSGDYRNGQKGAIVEMFM